MINRTDEINQVLSMPVDQFDSTIEKSFIQRKQKSYAPPKKAMIY